MNEIDQPAVAIPLKDAKRVLKGVRKACKRLRREIEDVENRKDMWWLPAPESYHENPFIIRFPDTLRYKEWELMEELEKTVKATEKMARDYSYEKDRS